MKRKEFVCRAWLDGFNKSRDRVAADACATVADDWYARAWPAKQAPDPVTPWQETRAIDEVKP